MKKARSYLALCLAVFMCLSLAACGDKTKSYTLTAEDADLTDAPNVVLEPDKAPFNLGGWGYMDVVTFNFTGLADDGEYSLTMNYAKDGLEGDDALILASAGEGQTLEAVAPATAQNWDTYKDFTFPDNVYVTGGEITLEIEANYDFQGEYLMNLRSVTLTYIGEGTAPVDSGETEEEALTLADIEGYWQEVDIGDYYYFDGSDGWICYNESGGEIVFEGSLTDNGDGTFTLDEIDLGYYGDVEFNVQNDTATLITDIGTQYDLAYADSPTLGVGDRVSGENVFEGEWAYEEDGSVSSIILGDNHLGTYVDGEFLGGGTYDPDAGVYTMETEDGSDTASGDMYVDTNHNILYITMDGVEYGFNRVLSE